MNEIIYKSFSGKDGRKWANIGFVVDDYIAQWFGELKNCPIDPNANYEITNVQSRGKYGVVTLVAESGELLTVFVNIIV